MNVMKFTGQQAASIIQRAWRRYLDTEVFHFYRKLLASKSKLSRNTLSHCLAPGEKSLLDEAAGGFVMFRLEGSAFPPTVCYKIFTYRPIQDINAYSPKHYSEMRPKSARSENNWPEGPSINLNSDNLMVCYERYENNDWRPIYTENLFNLPNPEFVVQKSVKSEFLKTTLERKRTKADRRRKRRQMWIEWMLEHGLDPSIKLHQADEPNADKFTRHYCSLTYPSSKKLSGKADTEQHERVGETSSERLKSGVYDSSLTMTSGTLQANKEYGDFSGENTEELSVWIEYLDYDTYIDSWNKLATTLDYAEQ
ncbi:unnamed protein product [Calicophoron daubneyi]|uniref:Uncharacterized protein n=1 Tax=Calicophoron daubneyi TaxID=300641 RepID=A0AAV2TW81_CALDB